jgi:cytochrome c-type biogenesis protein CcmH
MPVLALAVYLTLGQPQLPGHEFAGTPAATVATGDGRPLLPDVETLAQQLAARLEKNPSDAKGWRMLGWSYFSIEKFPEAAKAYARAVALLPKDSDLHSAYAEAVIRTAGGFVTPEARKIVDETLSLDAKEPRARFFRGLAFEQENKHREALDIWLSIARRGPADAEWMPGLRERVRAVALKLRLDPDKLLPRDASAAPIPSVAVAAEPVPATAAEIERMAKRLESNPRDYQGWILLARGYKARGETQLAQASLARARELFANAPFVMGELAKAADELSLAGPTRAVAPAAVAGPDQEQINAAMQLDPQARQQMIDGMVGGLARKLEADPKNLDGWIMLARSRKVLGDAAAADKALARARQVFAGDTAAQDKIASAAHELGLAGN